jgi:hypothetical protein
MLELPEEWAALAYKMLGFKAPLEVFYVADMRCAKLRICINRVLQNYCEAMMLRWKPSKNAHLLYVNSAFLPISALPDRLSLRFSTPCQGDLFQHKRKGSKCHP